MVTAAEAADEYRSVLSDLTRNDKTQINLLTILAEDYASYSEEIVKVIEETLLTCSVPLKIVILYVVDSIVKNVTVTGGYREQFAKKIVNMIVHVFKESDERTRASIHRLRCTWGDIFPKSRLYMIDLDIHAIDRAWPIMNPNASAPTMPTVQPGGHVVHVNPRFLNGNSKQQPAPTTTTIAPAPALKPAIKAVKKEPPPVVKEEDVSSTTPEPSSSTGSLVVTIKNDNVKKSPEKQVKKEKSEEGPPPSDNKKKSPKEAKKNGSKEEKAKKGGEKAGKSAKKIPSDQATAKERRKSRDSKEQWGEGSEKRKRVLETIQVKKLKQETGRIPKKTTPLISGDMPKPESLLTLRVAPPNFPQSQQQQQIPQPKAPQPSKQQMPTIPTPPKRPRQSQPPPQMQPQPPPQQQQHGYMQKKQQHAHPQALPEPTAALGAHAFGRVATAIPLGANTPPQPMDTSGGGPPLLDQSCSASMMAQPLPTPLYMDTSTLVNTPQSFQPAIQHNIQNVTPRLPGVPENNRIFVDGKAYEVFYLDEIAVIERNGLPHRVSFAGPPRDVIIDGVASRMAFGEQKQVLIDGEVHLLRFGAPSRELYMGHYPFKGAFGGPPIIATVNGRRHEIRLCGPAPEVRIDPEPSYELMRYMPAIRQQQPKQHSPRIEQPTREPAMDVTSLLKRLRNSGVLTRVSEAERKTRERLVALEAKGQAIGRSNSPPVPCSHRLDHIERRAMPMAGFDQFSMRSLIIRYDSVIDAIHRQRKACQHCGIGFEELYGEAYQRHVDWHLQDTLKMKDPRHKYTRSQPWYRPEEDWSTYSETELVNRSRTMEVEKQADDAKGSSPQGQQTTADGNHRDAPSDSIETKECQVCHEQFEEYWDEDEDVWRLRDCVLQNGKAYHSNCRDDEHSGERSDKQNTEDGPPSAADDQEADSDLRAATTSMDVDMAPNKRDERMDEDGEGGRSQMVEENNAANLCDIPNKQAAAEATTGSL